jgi:hypothetical protein
MPSFLGSSFTAVVSLRGGENLRFLDQSLTLGDGMLLVRRILPFIQWQSFETKKMETERLSQSQVQ